MSWSKPMALGKYEPKMIRSWSGLYISEKHDGWRITWHPDEACFRTRSGAILPAPEGLLEAAADIAPENMLDGELVKPKDGPHIYYVFDAPDIPGDYKTRLQFLLDRFHGANHETVRLVQQSYYRNTERIDNVIQAELKTVTDRGGEGIVIRNETGLYATGISKDALKLKTVDTCELIVVGYHRTKTAIDSGKPENYVSSLICYTEDEMDLRITVKTEEPPPIGAIIEVKYTDKTVNGLPKFPVYLGTRADESIDPELLAKFLRIREEHFKLKNLKLQDFKSVETKVKPKGPSNGGPKNQYSLTEEQIELFEMNRNCKGIYYFDQLCRAKKTGKTLVKLDPGQFILLSSGQNTYKVTQPKKVGLLPYCTCPAWLFARLPAWERSCKHCEVVIAQSQPQVQ